MKETFVLRTENRQVIERMSNEDAGALLKALMAHADGEEVDLDSLSGKADVVYLQMAAQMDRMEAAYQEKIEKRRLAGLMSGEARANKNEQTRTNANKSEQTGTKTNKREQTVNKNEQTRTNGEQKETIPVPVPVPVPVSPKGDKRESARARARITPPTKEEVRAYAKENGLILDADRFVDYYTANGWIFGGKTMEDWTAAARYWSSRDKPKQPDVDYNTILNELDRRREEDAAV